MQVALIVLQHKNGGLCAGITCNLATFETKAITTARTDAATFTARAPATVAVAFH